MSEPTANAFKPKSKFLQVLQERGYIHQCTDLEALDKAASEGVVTAYVGYDCTADSLHIGHLISIMMLRWLQKTGHRPITLMGGGTTKVGDPTDKDKQRPLLTDAQIADVDKAKVVGDGVCKGPQPSNLTAAVVSVLSATASITLASGGH
jgi:tyrosyl-tRNA synthetase